MPAGAAPRAKHREGLRSMKLRRLSLGVAAAAGICVLGSTTAVPAQADPLPQFTPLGTTLYTFGNANFCTGTITVRPSSS